MNMPTKLILKTQYVTISKSIGVGNKKGNKTGLVLMVWWINIWLWYQNRVDQNAWDWGVVEINMA